VLTRVLVFGVLLLAIAPPVSAQTYYIRDGGTASTTGTGACVSTGSGDWNTANACDDFPTTLVRGATYYVADGTYAYREFSTAVSGTTLITIKKAIASDHGTDTGWVSTYGDGQASYPNWYFTSNYWTVNGQGANFTTYGFVLTDPNHNSLNGVIRTGLGLSTVTWQHIHIWCGNSGTAANNSRGIKMSSSGTAYTITNVKISYCQDDAIKLNGSDATIEYLWINERGARDDAACGTGCHGDAVEIGESGDGTTAVTLRYSKVDWNGQQLYWGPTAQNHTWTIYGNLFYGGIGSGKCVHTKDPVNLTVYYYNNTCANVTTQAAQFGPAAGFGRNNIFHNTSTSLGWGSMTHTHNYYGSAYGGGNLSAPAGETDGQTGGGDPFVDGPNENFHLAAATNAGYDTGSSYNTDLDGETRGADGVWDRGGYEYVAGGGSPLDITTSSPLAAGTVGAAYSVTLSVGGGTSPYTWSNNAAGTTLNDADASCAGLTISSGGVVSGTPTTAGDCDWTAKVTDNVAATDTQAYTITVSTITITTSSPLTGASEDLAYSVTISATGGTTPYTWTESGSALGSGACAGLSLADSGDTAVVSGIPSTPGTCTFTAQVSDNNTVTQTKQFSITVTGSSSGGLINTALAVRYYFDEASSGTTPTTALDHGGADAPLTLDYGSGNMAYALLNNNRGLDSSAVTGTQKASRSINDETDAIREFLQGVQKITVELVTRVDVRATAGQSRIFGIIDEASDIGRLMVKIKQDQDLFYFSMNDTNYESWVMTTTEFAVWHVVIDTTAAAADDRVVVYKDGTAVTSTVLGTITQNATLDLSVSQQLIAMNRIASERSFDGRLAYAALYAHAMTEAEVDQNVAVLTVSDDAPPETSVSRHRLRIRASITVPGQGGELCAGFAFVSSWSRPWAAPSCMPRRSVSRPAPLQWANPLWRTPTWTRPSTGMPSW
jgi:hypothetical protein